MDFNTLLEQTNDVADTLRQGKACGSDALGKRLVFVPNTRLSEIANKAIKGDIPKGEGAGQWAVDRVEEILEAHGIDPDRDYDSEVYNTFTVYVQAKAAEEEELTTEEYAAALGLKTDMGRVFLEIALENVKTFDRKQADYGSGNISAFGEQGVLVRANDKIERLKNLLKDGAEPSNETVEDSWLDLANYGLIGALLRRGDWK